MLFLMQGDFVKKDNKEIVANTKYKWIFSIFFKVTNICKFIRYQCVENYRSVNLVGCQFVGDDISGSVTTYRYHLESCQLFAYPDQSGQEFDSKIDLN